MGGWRGLHFSEESGGGGFEETGLKLHNMDFTVHSR